MTCRKKITRHATLFERVMAFEGGVPDGGLLLIREKCKGEVDDDGRCRRCGGIYGRRASKPVGIVGGRR